MSINENGDKSGRFDYTRYADDRQFVIALARGLELLRTFKQGEEYLGITELAKRTDLPKPTVSRLAGTLTKLGYLELSSETGKYRLGPGVLALGYAKLSNFDVRQVARPMMQELAAYSLASVSIAIRDRLSMVYIESIRSNVSITLNMGVGARLSLASSAIGRAYLAGITQAERDFLMSQLEENDKTNWPRIKAGIEQTLRDYEEYGFCISIGDWNQNIHGVGVPFIAPDGTVMAFNVGGTTPPLLTENRIKTDIGPRLIELVRQVESIMGCGG